MEPFVVFCCLPCSKIAQGEALYMIVLVVLVVFPYKQDVCPRLVACIVKKRKMSPECFGIQGFFVFLHRGYAFRLLADANLAPSKGREAEGDIIKKVEI